jgi:hypothetical protein
MAGPLALRRGTKWRSARVPQRPSDPATQRPSPLGWARQMAGPLALRRGTKSRGARVTQCHSATQPVGLGHGFSNPVWRLYQSFTTTQVPRLKPGATCCRRSAARWIRKRLIGRASRFTMPRRTGKSVVREERRPSHTAATDWEVRRTGREEAVAHRRDGLGSPSYGKRGGRRTPPRRTRKSVVREERRPSHTAATDWEVRRTAEEGDFTNRQRGRTGGSLFAALAGASG